MLLFWHGLMFRPHLGVGGWVDVGLATLGGAGFHFAHSHHSCASEHCTCLAFLTAVCGTAWPIS